MVGHRHPESLARIDVSSRVVVTLGVFRSFLCRCVCAEEEEEEEGEGESAAEKLLLDFGAEEKLHCALALRARSHWLPMRFRPLTGFEELFFLPPPLLHPGF